jgi:branched-chain amino acid transport system substrate-binding protein
VAAYSRLLPIPLVFVLALGVACATGEEPADGVISIGVAQPLSGPVAAAGTAVSDGARIAADEINASGGINGRKIELRVEDHGNDPATCANVAQRFASREPVSAVLGAWGSSCTLAMEPVLSRAQLPLLVETSSSDKITDRNQQGNEWTFRISPTSTMEAVALQSVLADMGIGSAFTLSVNTDFGIGAAAAYGGVLRENGAQVVGEARFDQSEQSFATFVTQAIASGADTWIVTSDAPQIALLLREARGQGAQARIITTGGSNSPIQVRDLAGPDAARGTYATMFYPVFDPSLAADPDAASYFERAWREGGHEPGEITEGVRGYQGIKVLESALRTTTDPTDRTEVRDALSRVQLDGAIYGRIAFGDWRTLMNQTTPPVYLVRTEGAELQLVGTGNPPY